MLIIFGGEEYYANAGVYSILKIFPSDKPKYVVEIAKSLIGKVVCHGTDEWSPEIRIEWVQVYDTDKDEILFEQGRPYSQRTLWKNKVIV